MIYDYVVTLKNTHRKTLDIFSVLLLGIAVVIFIREQWMQTDTRLPYLYFISALIVGLAGWNIQQQRKTGRTVFYGRVFFIAAIGWALTNNNKHDLHWLIIPFVILALVERTAKKPLEVGFTRDRIVINQIFKKTYQWTDFSNIVLKDDLLTLDFKNNRLLQMETVDEESDTGEDEFNDYCTVKLNAPPAAES